MKVLDGPKASKRLTGGSNAAQQNGAAVVYINKQETHNRNSGLAAPMVGKEIYSVELMAILSKDTSTPD